MLLGKKRKLGRMIDEINPGEKVRLSEKIEDKDLLLFLGLTDDNNPLFIQHDYASLTPYKKPIVPQIMLTGMVTGAVSKIMPGPGSSILSQTLQFPKPVHHYSEIHFLLTVRDVDKNERTVTIDVTAEDDQGDMVIKGQLVVSPPYPPEPVTSSTFDNF
ncbi:acyl dehydratase [Scopulibacillus darangshiensis]|uniref:Acyl dehydratase n=1 Tax=Scopulibacillus darangshiensis TaxID=442528 RepID=A0A4V2SNQ4_9BACL|nr:MaoC/PaaZ C-terminal domain-containing protein [Scopulibacillus darangshiensis]TCP32096.1 acyl dehydratase [Scopulibacillus darangshiensis]